MAEENVFLVRRQFRSPPAAAVAGIIYAVLMTTGMLLTASIVATSPADIEEEALEVWSASTSIVVVIVPFAGLAFLWFTGVIRDNLGNLEDRFFSTVFFGSGIISVVTLFIWGATAGAIFSIHTQTVGQVIDNDIYIFGFAFMNQIIGNYGLRMAGVYMLSIGTIWTRSGVMPRWMSIITFIIALSFLTIASRVRVARFMFPAWVFVVSVYTLIRNYLNLHGKKRGKTADKTRNSTV